MNLNNQICSALLNREVTHSALRLYVALALVVPHQKQTDFAEIYVDRLKEAIPGVRGKPLGDGPLRENLRELQRLDLIELAGHPWSRHSVHVKLRNRPVSDTPEGLREQIVVPEDQTWTPEAWRQSR